MDKKPLILAHRGLVTEYQENTLEAIQGAIDNPHCDGAEFDVFLTKDNKVVLFHDENMKRLTGVDKSIYEMTWEELKNIQVLPEIEVDGDIHLLEEQVEYDQIRESILESMGYKVIRFRNIEVLKEWEKVEEDLRAVFDC